jgi:hypothetical protein
MKIATIHIPYPRVQLTVIALFFIATGISYTWNRSDAPFIVEQILVGRGNTVIQLQDCANVVKTTVAYTSAGTKELIVVYLQHNGKRIQSRFYPMCPWDGRPKNVILSRDRRGKDVIRSIPFNS